MTGKRTPHVSSTGVDEGPDDLDFEPWLRRAVGSDDSRVPLPRQGQVVGGKYRIEEELGRGGMGAVYRATHLVSGKAVALKWMLRPATDPRVKARFRREATAAGRVDHPNVVDVYDIGEEGAAGYLVMELLHGESLRSRLERGPLDPEVAVQLLLPAMRGVSAAHRQGVVHRDLKPDNLFLCQGPDGEPREAKVLDFGISRLNGAEESLTSPVTRDGVILGTVAYMSPEQLENVPDVDARTDVYAFGVILYEALTGRTPFGTPSLGATVLAIANTDPPSPAGLRAAVSEELGHKDRARRLQDMEGFIAALAPFAGQHASAGRRPRAESTARKNPARWGLAAALALAGVGVLSWRLASSHRPSAQPPTLQRVVLPSLPGVAAGSLDRAAPVAGRASDSGAISRDVPPPAEMPGAVQGTPPATRQPTQTTVRTPVRQPLRASATPAVAAPVNEPARAGAIHLNEL
jgi:eukaryotic-like serine/threonine-protein kinase